MNVGRVSEQDEIDRERETTFLNKGRTNGCRLLRSCHPLPQTPLWKSILTCGLRFGEMAAARWCDFDADDGVLTVRGGTTKSGKTRHVPVPPQLAADLVALRHAQTRHFGHTPATTERIFLSPCSASPLQNRTTRTLFDRILDRAGIAALDEQGRSIDIHALRGTAATRMLRFGVNLPIVSEIMGHCDMRLTMKHYTDLRIADTRRAVPDVPELVRAATANANAS